MSKPAQPHPDVAQVAAYLLGRNLCEIGGWQMVLWRMSLTPERPWKLEYPDTLFVQAFKEPPYDAFYKIRETLQILVQKDKLEGAPLVELHRLVEEIADDCEEITSMVSTNDRKGIIETYWQSSSDLNLAIEFAEQCVRNTRSLAYFSLGNIVGRMLQWACNHVDIETAKMLASKLVFQLKHNKKESFAVPFKKWLTRQDTSGAKSQDVSNSARRELANELLDLDKHFGLPAYDDSEAPKPIIELDDSAEAMFVFGQRIPLSAFSDSKSRGGLKVFRVLMQQPEKILSSSTLQKQAQVSRDKVGIKEYLSAFRSVVRSYIDDGNDEHVISQLPESYRSAAHEVFIVADRSRSKSHRQQDPRYLLKLPAYLVSYKS